MPDEAEDVPRERGHALEAPVAQNTALKDAEPDLDLVDPGGMQRGVNEAKAMSVLPVESRPASLASVVVQVEVVPDDVDTAALVAMREGVHEGQQCARVAVANDAPEDLTGADVEGREQRACPATTVLELVADDAMTTHVDGVTPSQRLHGLLVDAQDDGVLGRAAVEATDPRDLRSEVGIRGMEPVADTVRTPATRSQHASNGTAAYPLAAACMQSVRDRLVGPDVAKDHAVVLRPLACQLDDLAPSLQRDPWWPAASGRVKKRLDARASLPPGSPLAYDPVAAPSEQCGPGRATSVRKPDNDPWANDDVVLPVPPSRERLDARPLPSRDANSSRSRTRIHLPSIHEPRLSFPWTDRSRDERGMSYSVMVAPACIVIQVRAYEGAGIAA